MKTLWAAAPPVRSSRSRNHMRSWPNESGSSRTPSGRGVIPSRASPRASVFIPRPPAGEGREPFS